MSSSDIKRGVLVISFFIVLATLSFQVNAFGVSTPYLENDTLKVLPGQNYTYTLTLQNGDPEDYYVDIIYSSTDNVAKLLTKTFYTPAKTYDNTFDFHINIPLDAEIGKIYILEYSAKPRIDNNGTINLGVEIKRNVKILVTDETSTNIKPVSTMIQLKEDSVKLYEKTNKYLIILITLLTAIFVIVLIWKMARKIALKIHNRRKTTHTISEAKNLREVKVLLQKISDKQYDIPEIRALFKNKMSELTNNEIVGEIHNVSRKDVITALDKILK